jgi:hypothetical protein
MSDAERSYEKALKAAHDATRLYADYWRGSLRRYLLGSPKGRTHEAHAQWLSDCTTDLVVDMDTARAIIAGVEKWRAAATVARTLGVAEPSVLPYLPISIPRPEGLRS